MERHLFNMHTWYGHANISHFTTPIQTLDCGLYRQEVNVCVYEI